MNEEKVKIIEVADDYFYTTRLRQVTYLMHHGFEVDHKDENGYFTIFYFKSSPELIKTLNKQQRERGTIVYYV